MEKPCLYETPLMMRGIKISPNPSLRKRGEIGNYKGGKGI